jgi:hypothetical protein
MPNSSQVNPWSKTVISFQNESTIKVHLKWESLLVELCMNIDIGECKHLITFT